MSYNKGKNWKKKNGKNNNIIISDFTLGWYNNNKEEEHLLELIDYLNKGNKFSVILPTDYTNHIKVPYKVQISNEQIMSKSDGSMVYQIYKDTKSIVVSNFEV